MESGGKMNKSLNKRRLLAGILAALQMNLYGCVNESKKEELGKEEINLKNDNFNYSYNSDIDTLIIDDFSYQEDINNKLNLLVESCIKDKDSLMINLSDMDSCLYVYLINLSILDRSNQEIIRNILKEKTIDEIMDSPMLVSDEYFKYNMNIYFRDGNVDNFIYPSKYVVDDEQRMILNEIEERIKMIVDSLDSSDVQKLIHELLVDLCEDPESKYVELEPGMVYIMQLYLRQLRIILEFNNINLYIDDSLLLKYCALQDGDPEKYKYINYASDKLEEIKKILSKYLDNELVLKKVRQVAKFDNNVDFWYNFKSIDGTLFQSIDSLGRRD